MPSAFNTWTVAVPRPSRRTVRLLSRPAATKALVRSVAPVASSVAVTTYPVLPGRVKVPRVVAKRPSGPVLMMKFGPKLIRVGLFPLSHIVFKVELEL